MIYTRKTLILIKHILLVNDSVNNITNNVYNVMTIIKNNDNININLCEKNKIGQFYTDIMYFYINECLKEKDLIGILEIFNMYYNKQYKPKFIYFRGGSKGDYWLVKYDKQYMNIILKFNKYFINYPLIMCGRHGMCNSSNFKGIDLIQDNFCI